MRTRLVGLCALIALLATAAHASAGQARRITLQIGDAFVVAGTDLACETQIGKNVMRGQKLVTCFKVKGGRLPVNSYVVALGADGRVAVAKAKADGSVGAPVFNRKPARLGSGTKQITVHAGDELLVSGTDLGCAINNDRSGIYPACFRATSKGGRPGSYGFAETEAFVAVVQFDSTGKTTKAVFRRAHGH